MYQWSSSTSSPLKSSLSSSYVLCVVCCPDRTPTRWQYLNFYNYNTKLQMRFFGFQQNHLMLFLFVQGNTCCRYTSEGYAETLLISILNIYFLYWVPPLIRCNAINGVNKRNIICYIQTLALRTDVSVHHLFVIWCKCCFVKIGYFPFMGPVKLAFKYRWLLNTCRFQG